MCSLKASALAYPLDILIFLFIHPSIYPSINHLPTNPPVHPSIHLSVHPTICSNTYPRIYPTNHPCIYSSIHSSIHPCISIVIHFKYLLCSSCEPSTLLLQEETTVNISLTWQRNKLLHSCEINTTIEENIGCTWAIWFGQERL